ncbi:MAG: zinc ABC transporter substrate-binding protein [Planctomycetaceae bacterium]
MVRGDGIRGWSISNDPLWTRRSVIQAALLVAVGCAGCETGNSSGSASADRPTRFRVICTTGMVADLAAHVAGDRAEVIALYGAVDPHTYEPTQTDIEKILAADVVLYSGLMLEGPTQVALESARGRGKLVRAVTDGVARESGYLRFPDGATTHPDPHVWHDVAAWGRCADVVANALAEHDPAHADEYKSRAAAYQQELAAIDAYARERIATIPAAQRHLVTAHDAFEYFSRAYAIPVRSVLGITTTSEAGVDDINRLVDFLVENKVPAVFVEATVNRANLQAVVEGAKRRGWNVRIGGSLYSDSMGPPGTYTGSYIGMIDYNVTLITRSLGGEAPERGFNNRLNLPAPTQD